LIFMSKVMIKRARWKIGFDIIRPVKFTGIAVAISSWGNTMESFICPPCLFALADPKKRLRAASASHTIYEAHLIVIPIATQQHHRR
jgi:hypothetical protein